MLYKMPCPATQLLFVASTIKEEGPARGEIAAWAHAHGYHAPREDQAFVFYQDGVEARQWRLLERQVSTAASGTGC